MRGNLAPREPRKGILKKSAEEFVDPRALKAWKLPLTPVTVITEPGEAAPASPMVLLSTALLHRLLATARAIGLRRARLEPPAPEETDVHVDIKV